MISRRSTYAVRALVRLAERSGEPQLASELAADAGIPRRFLEAILAELTRHGLLRARRGRHGGYVLRSSPESIDLATVVRVVDGPVLPFPCLDPRTPSRCPQCPGAGSCAAQILLNEVAGASAKALERITLADLVRRSGNPHRQ